jgi:hypothetical protein
MIFRLNSDYFPNRIYEFIFVMVECCVFFEVRTEFLTTGLFKNKYTLSKMYFTSTIKYMATCYIWTEGKTIKVIFAPYKHSM